jgi:hypothetical protein
MAEILSLNHAEGGSDVRKPKDPEFFTVTYPCPPEEAADEPQDEPSADGADAAASEAVADDAGDAAWDDAGDDAGDEAGDAQAPPAGPPVTPKMPGPIARAIAGLKRRSELAGEVGALRAENERMRGLLRQHEEAGARLTGALRKATEEAAGLRAELAAAQAEAQRVEQAVAAELASLGVDPAVLPEAAAEGAAGEPDEEEIRRRFAEMPAGAERSAFFQRHRKVLFG